jgi:hypothetical protein
MRRYPKKSSAVVLAVCGAGASSALLFLCIGLLLPLGLARLTYGNRGGGGEAWLLWMVVTAGLAGLVAVVSFVVLLPALYRRLRGSAGGPSVTPQEIDS